MVRQETLTLSFVGSNPATPAKIKRRLRASFLFQRDDLVENLVQAVGDLELLRGSAGAV